MSEPSPAPGSERRRRLRRRLGCALLAAFALVAAVLGEVVARAFAPADPASLRRYVPDPSLGFRLRAGHSDELATINSRGLRDPERTLAKPEGVRRILLLGDSFSFGASLPAEDCFARRLEHALPGVEVINSGVPGWSTVQQTRWLEQEGLAYQPDLILLAFFVGNDVAENAGLDALQVVDGALVPRAERAEHSWFRRLRNKSQLYRLIKRLPERLSDAMSGDSTQARWYHKVARDRLGVCATGEQAQSWEEGWQATGAALRRLRELAGALPVVVLLIPDEFQVSEPLRGALAKRYGLDLTSYDLDQPQRRLRALVSGLGFALVDPLEAFRARIASGEELYIPHDSHWNAAGHQLAADALSDCPPISNLARE